MEPEQIMQYCLNNLEDTILVESWGEKGVFYNPNNTLKRGIYILTIKEKDGDNDKGSNLDRKGIYRVNIGIKKETFIKLFKEIPERPKAGEIVNMDYDFTKANVILPHPVYAWMGWICILNPTEEMFERIKP
jgi:hypothetical protein